MGDPSRHFQLIESRRVCLESVKEGRKILEKAERTSERGFSFFTDYKSANRQQGHRGCPTQGQKEPTAPLVFINTRRYLCSVSLTQSSLRHRESVHLSSTVLNVSLFSPTEQNRTIFQSHCDRKCSLHLKYFPQHL